MFQQNKQYNVKEYKENYAKVLGSVWQYFIDEPDDGNVADFESFKFKSRFANNTGTVNIEIPVPLKYFSNFCRTFKMPLINCEIRLDLTCSANFVICETGRGTTFAITDTKLFVPVVTLSSQDNANL